uniref:Methyltransferase-like protein 9 n=1 Tax=Caligus rogercresseyi TaxID=217165 RepID=C1BNR2_CALRO|nr:Methyltransferase-like protein 9 precursor [Caligus rogercresseyi]
MGRLRVILWTFFVLGWFMAALLGSRSARLLVSKFNEDAKLLNPQNKASWYGLQTKSDEEEGESTPGWVQLGFDEETEGFVQAAVEKSDRFWLQVYHNLAIPLLKLFYTQTDVNGFLRRGSMFVLSLEQARRLLPPGETTYKSLLDLGAGDGEVTLRLKPLFSQLYATETSSMMRSLLSSKGFKLLEVDSWDSSGPFDAISCFNLLDRASSPLSIIRSIKKALGPNGVLLLALVYPFRPYVEFGASREPLQRLNISTESFASHVASIVKLFDSEGFKLRTYSRVPYLCEGDLHRSLYSLDDSIFVFNHA